ncbi:MAG TPA: prepilin-type N-terminal cleavage/methylation domain-containing protein [Verrucomicrobiae bacterium]|nr:prepilin-type N-terminal cleavage/methylation domain-containing protein [Verrucomicrobiae bacterium]
MEPRRASPVTSESGFTLIELMITMAVVLVALVGYVAANIAVQQASNAAFQNTVALQDANRVIEQMRNTSVGGTFPGNVTAVYPNNGAVAGFNNLTNEAITVSYSDATANPLTVTVSVSWLENGRRNVNTALRTLITQRS